MAMNNRTASDNGIKIVYIIFSTKRKFFLPLLLGRYAVAVLY